MAFRKKGVVALDITVSFYNRDGIELERSFKKEGIDRSIKTFQVSLKSFSQKLVQLVRMVRVPMLGLKFDCGPFSKG